MKLLTEEQFVRKFVPWDFIDQHGVDQWYAMSEAERLRWFRKARRMSGKASKGQCPPKEEA
jgi:hypothetical protein